MTLPIETPESASLDELCAELSARADALDTSGAWPSEQMELLGRFGVYRWFMPREFGGYDWSAADTLRGYMRLSEACLTTTFILTQRTGACRRIVECDNQAVRQRLAPALASGGSFATVGISHLTTSRRYLATPALHATETSDGFVLNGYSPWVTGARYAQHAVIGATLDDGRQVLVTVPCDLPGVRAEEPSRLVALSASMTGALVCDHVHVGHEWVLAGPVDNVMAHGGAGANTGGLQTSTVALGLARAAIGFIEREQAHRPELREPAESLRREHAGLVADLLAAAEDRPVCTNEDLRFRANQFVLRATQAALTTAKGAGFVAGHPAGRWCREALFFLVWSCPQPVMNAALCELAGLG